MKLAIRIQITMLVLLLLYYGALFCGYEVPVTNRAEVEAGKDLILLLLNVAGLTSIIHSANDKMAKEESA